MTAETAGVELPAGIDLHRSAAWQRAAAAFVVTLLLGFAIIAGFVIGYQRAFADRAVLGVSVGGVPIGGLDRTAAEATLRARLPSATDGVLVLRSPAGDIQVPFARLDRSYDYAALLDAAFAVGHGADPATNLAQDVRALVRGDAVGVRLTYSRSALVAAIAQAAGIRSVAPTDASAALGPGGTFVLTSAASGSAIDQAAALAAADRVLVTPGNRAVVDLAALPTSPGVSTAAANAAIQVAEQMTAQPLTLTVAGQPTLSATIDAATLRTWIAFTTTGQGYGPVVGTAAAKAALLQLAPKVNRPPKDATYLLGDGKVVGVLASRDGSQLDVGASLAAIGRSLAAQPAGGPPPTVQLVMSSVAPALSTAQAKQTAPLMTMVGSWTTHFVPGISNYWGRNISIPAAKIDGYVVTPGAWFDFWKVVGVPTLAEGYGMGGAIIDGHTEETGAIAGGICSTSTTLFNAALRAGYEIGDRANHYYYISRYPVGLDATVALGTGWEQDMTWRNDTSYPVLIHAINGPGTVTFQLFSVDPGRTVTLSTPIIKNYTYATTKYVDVTTLKPGQTNQVEYASNGFDAWVTRTVTDASGAVIHEETFYSHYATVNGLIQVGVKELPLPSASAGPSAGATAAP